MARPSGHSPTTADRLLTASRYWNHAASSANPPYDKMQRSRIVFTAKRRTQGHFISTKPTFVDVFCGAGLFSEGFRLSGFRPLYAVDLDPDAIISYRQNVASVAEIRDARNIPSHLTTDVLIAGPPCQGFSTLGRQDPTDERNLYSLLVPTWAQATQANVVVIENVPKFLVSPIAKRLILQLETLEYRVTHCIIQATSFGVAQRRERCFIVASRLRPFEPPLHTSPKTPSAGRDLLRRSFSPTDPMHIWPNPSSLALERFRAIPPNGDKRDLMLHRADLCPPSWWTLGCQATDVWGRVDPSRPANTLRCTFQNASKGRYVHPFENRVLSLREGARLQGIPDRWKLHGKPYPVARQIGNGVPVPMAAAVARQILQTL